MQNDTIVKVSLFYSAKIHEVMRIRIENHFFTNWKQKKNIFKNKFGFFSFESHIVPKTQEALHARQTFRF